MRLFIAATIPTKIREALVKIQDDFKEFPAKWVKKENLHITLVFIGDIENGQPARHHAPARGGREKDIVQETLEVIKRSTENFGRIRLETNGVVLFPNEHKAHLLIVDLAGELGRLHLLTEEIKRRLREAKIDFDEKSLHPHVTLARLKPSHPRKRRKVRQKVDAYEIPKETFDVEEIALVESNLTPAGPIYKTLKTVNLK